MKERNPFVKNRDILNTVSFLNILILGVSIASIIASFINILTSELQNFCLFYLIILFFIILLCIKLSKIVFLNDLKSELISFAKVESLEDVYQIDKSLYKMLTFSSYSHLLFIIEIFSSFIYIYFIIYFHNNENIKVFHIYLLSLIGSLFMNFPEYFYLRKIWEEKKHEFEKF